MVTPPGGVPPSLQPVALSPDKLIRHLVQGADTVLSQVPDLKDCAVDALCLSWECLNLYEPWEKWSAKLVTEFCSLIVSALGAKNIASNLEDSYVGSCFRDESVGWTERESMGASVMIASLDPQNQAMMGQLGTIRINPLQVWHLILFTILPRRET